MLTVQEIQAVNFEKAVFGGYDMKAVDEFLEHITEDYAAMQKENAALKEKAAAAAAGDVFKDVKEANGVRGEEIVISTPDSKVNVYVVPTNEELAIARETVALVQKHPEKFKAQKSHPEDTDEIFW